MRRQAKRDAAFELPTLLAPHQSAVVAALCRCTPKACAMSPVHGADARSILEVEAFHEPRSSEREFAHFWKEIRADSRRLLRGSFMLLMRFKKEMEASHEAAQCSARFWTMAVLCRYASATRWRKRQRTAALQDADALAIAPFRFMAPMRVQCWRLKLSHDLGVSTHVFDW